MSRQFEIESLEARALLSVTTLNYANFATTSRLVSNGFGASPVTVANDLQLTSNRTYQARSVWYDTAVPISNFRTDFTFQIDKNSDGADGLTFTIQNGSTSFLGSNGRDLGYGKTTAINSVALAFDQYNFYEFGSKFGFASNGEKPPTDTVMNPIDLHGGDVLHVTATYDGKMLRVAVVDLSEPTKIFGASEHINLTRAIGSDTAFVGFTAATGANRSTQTLLSWNYTGSDSPTTAPASAPTAPSFINAAQSTPEPVTGGAAHLLAFATDSNDPESALTYRWRVVSMPAGAATPTFRTNGNNSASSTIARFSKDGAYRFRCTVTNTAGLTVSSSVNVRVVQTATSIRLTPHQVNLHPSERVTFAATMLDQFGHAMRTQPTFHYSIASGSGKINSSSGLYIAPTDVDHVLIDASAGGLNASVGVTIKPKDLPPSVSE